jgi:hypothetical protein
MAQESCSDTDFIALWNKHKSAKNLSEILNITERRVLARRRSLEKRKDINLHSSDPKGIKYQKDYATVPHNVRTNLGLLNGTVIVFSDAHFWPGIRSTAFQGLLWAIQEFKPRAVINNGDAFDGASISRYPRIGWDTKPSLIGELKACEASLEEIETAAKAGNRQCKLIWTLGNHDARFENTLANRVPEFANIKGFTLKDHFQAWTPAWSCWATDDVVIKHRWKGGIHAVYNNSVMSGKSYVTGHLHSLKVSPFSDLNGTRYGVDTGTLAEPTGPQFIDYLEDNPVNWRSGFAILTIWKGHLLQPELVQVFDKGNIEFRGQVIDVSKL